MAASRVCRDCPRLIPAATYKGRCPTCARAHDKARGTKTERGYGSTVLHTPLGVMTYDQCRRAYQRSLDMGAGITCIQCSDPLDPEHWHLMHGDDNRGRIDGPGCPACNLSEAGRAAHRYR